MKKAIVTGITGQDGAYLAELLLKKVMRFTELSGGLLRSIFGGLKSLGLIKMSSCIL